MDKLHITGGRPLHGTVPISGAKNAALPVMAAQGENQEGHCLGLDVWSGHAITLCRRQSRPAIVISNRPNSNWICPLVPVFGRPSIA